LAVIVYRHQLFHVEQGARKNLVRFRDGNGVLDHYRAGGHPLAWF
jgi:hypothetical protein